MKVERCFKKKKWKEIISSFLAASTQTEAIALVYNEDIIWSCSRGGKRVPFRAPDLKFPLYLEGKEIGRFEVWGEDLQKEKLLWKSVVKFFQFWLETEYARRSVAEEALDRYREISFLNHIALGLNRSLDIKKVATTLMEECRRAVPNAKYGGVLYEDKGTFKLLASFGENVEDMAQKISETLLFREIIASRKPEIVNLVAGDPRWNAFIPQIISFLGAPLYSSNRILGGLFLAGSSSFNSFHLKSISTITAFGATALANALHFLEIQRLLEGIMVSLATAIDSRDPCTAGHSRRVAQYAWALAKAINEDKEYFPNFHFSPEELQEIYYAALLHDIGKIGVREYIISKATKLAPERLNLTYLKLKFLEKIGYLKSSIIEDIFTRIKKINSSGILNPEDRDFVLQLFETSFQISDFTVSVLDEEEKEALLIPKGNLLPQEWEEIKKHPVESERILKQIPFPQSMANLRLIIRQHHEKLNGSGYPDGKKGDEILLQSRILTVCDIYDALTAKDRPYKKAFPIEKAISILREEAASGKLDSRVVEIFVRKLIEWKE